MGTILPGSSPQPAGRNGIWKFYFLAALLSAATAAPAQEVEQVAIADGGAPAVGSRPTEADYDLLRKLLGVQAPPTREPKPAAAPASLQAPREPEPAVGQPAPRKPATPQLRSRPKPVAAPRKAPAFEAARPAWPAATTSTTEEPASPQAAEAAVPAPSFISADVPPPGAVIDASNLERWKGFLSPSIQWVVRRGARLPVVANEPIPMEPARAQATQAYSAQVRLSADKTHLENYVAGVPFPFVQSDDPDAGIKMISNWDGRIANDDLDIRNFSCQTGGIDTTGTIGGKTGMVVERDYLFGHFRRLYYVSRLYHEPKPTWSNAEGVRYREMLHPVMEPFDLKGAGFTYRRFLDARRQDDSWLYLPQTKRVRRVSTAQRSEGLFGQDIDLDSYGGYGGNPAWTDWRLLGTKTVLATMHGRSLPARWLPPPNDFLFDDVWEPRDVWVLEGRSRLPGYAFGSRVIYIDRESFIIPYTEIFDLQGRLWKGLVQNWQLHSKIRPDSKYAPDYKRLIIGGVSLFDMQLDHATRCQYPAAEFTNKEDGWYLNVGDEEGTTEVSFDVASLIGGGR